MRRKDREVREITGLLQILDECKVCRIAMGDNETRYIVPMNFGYTYENETLTLFFHSAKEGKKLDILRRNNQVAFEMDCNGSLISGDTACEYGYAFQSIIGSGEICFLEEYAEKKQALSILMKHQTGKEFQFEDAMTECVCVFKLEVSEFSGKCCSGLG